MIPDLHPDILAALNNGTLLGDRYCRRCEKFRNSDCSTVCWARPVRDLR